VRAFLYIDAKQARLILRIGAKKQKHQVLMFLKGFELGNCEEDVAEQPSRALG
jgi:hypothetical protein